MSDPTPSTPLVSPSWLASRLHTPGLVVLDATLPPVGVSPPIDTHARYLDRHIPGAIFFDIEQLSDHTTSLPHMLPTPEAFARSMSALGIGDDMTIVVYEQDGVFSAPRAWWMLRTFGARHVYLLDGGLRAWTEFKTQTQTESNTQAQTESNTQATLPTESGPVHHPPAAFRATLNRSAVADLAQLNSAIANHRQILDARSSARFHGTAPEPRPGLSSGHMPGATSVPFVELVEDGRLKPAASLRELFLAKHIDLQQPITTTCGSGVTAAVIALALEILSAPHVTLYDGSWAEYAQHPESIIEKSS